MTVIVVVNGELAADSMYINRPSMGHAYVPPMNGLKLFKSACGRAVSAKTSIATDQKSFERVFARYETMLCNIEIVHREQQRLTAHKIDGAADLVSFLELPYENETLTPEERSEQFGMIIMTRYSVISFNMAGAIVHSNRDPRITALTGADDNVTKALVALGYDAPTVALKHRQYSEYSGGEIHSFKAADLKPMVEEVKPAKKPRATTKRTAK